MKGRMRHFSRWVILGIVGCGSDPWAPDGGHDLPPRDAGEDKAMHESGSWPSDGASEGGRCAAEWETLANPIDLVSSGEVVLLHETPGKKTLYVDASAGGTQAASTNPRLYLSLETASKVGVTDRSAATSGEWDLALKRPVLFTNGGDAGSGRGGAVFLSEIEFASVGADDARGRTFASESFFEADCTPKLDATGALRTSFDEWYDYDISNNTLSPKRGTWLVRGTTGKVYKVRILTYYATPDGGAGQAGGRYTLEVGEL